MKATFRYERYEDGELVYVEVTVSLNEGQEYPIFHYAAMPCFSFTRHGPIDNTGVSLITPNPAFRALYMAYQALGLKNTDITVEEISLTNIGPTERDVMYATLGAIYKALGLEPDLSMELLAGG